MGGDAFGPYGVALTSLTRNEAAGIALEFLLVDDWEFDQGAIPRFPWIEASWTIRPG